jgi:hypothetical protein
MDDAGDGVPMLGAHDDDVPAVPVADDLILQVFRGVSSAHEAVKRRTQLRALSPQSVADVAERGAGVVVDVA